jgi:proteasome lid subunit RPN8/RPN11
MESGDLSAPAKACDISQIASATWPEQKCPASGGAGSSVRIVIARSVLLEIEAHGKSLPHVEVCGLMVGNVYQDDGGPYIHIEKMIRGEHADSQVAQVTFKPETWQHLYATLDRDYPTLRILGWYHTHPRFGIFLSEADLFIHHNFFSTPEQIALVYDPHSGEKGVFVWREGRATLGDCLIEEDVPNVNLRPEPIRLDLDMSDRPDLTTRVGRLERRYVWLAVGLGVLSVVVLAGALSYWRWRSASRPAPPREQELVPVVAPRQPSTKPSTPPATSPADPQASAAATTRPADKNKKPPEANKPKRPPEVAPPQPGQRSPLPPPKGDQQTPPPY